MKIRRITSLFVLLLIGVLTVSAISVDHLKTTIAWLADPAREGRHGGSRGAAVSAENIAAKLKEIGYTAQMQEFGGNRRNVIGHWGKADPYIVIGAHYDGQGLGFPSASDNAAGIAVVLELARELRDDELPVSVVAIAFDDEEQGMNGSRYYVDHSPYPLENARAAFIFDTLGRSFVDLSETPLLVLGTEYSAELASIVEKRIRPEMIVAGTDLIGPRSDFAPFALKHVPYLFFTNGTHKDYHGPGDTPDRIDYAHLAADTSSIAQIAKDTARLSAKPQYRADPVYPSTEAESLAKEIEAIQKERKDLPEAYRLMLEDLRPRLRNASSREIPQMAATAMLALATPHLSYFMLSFYLGPYYESQDGKHNIAAAIYEEAIKWSEPGAGRRALEEKVRTLRP
jgi:Peptidase family M28